MSGTIQVQGVDFGEMARQVIAAQIAKTFAAGNGEAVEKLVLGALTHMVNPENGNKPQSYERNSVTWVEYVAGDMIRQATKAALADAVEEMKPKIQAAVTAELKRSANGIAKALVDAYGAEARSGYRVSVAMQFQRHER